MAEEVNKEEKQEDNSNQTNPTTVSKRDKVAKFIKFSIMLLSTVLALVSYKTYLAKNDDGLTRKKVIEMLSSQENKQNSNNIKTKNDNQIAIESKKIIIPKENSEDNNYNEEDIEQKNTNLKPVNLTQNFENREKKFEDSEENYYEKENSYNYKNDYDDYSSNEYIEEYLSDGDIDRVNANVKKLQIFLISQGYNIRVDGIFRRQTKQALKAFQRDYGLKADGILGERTRKLINKLAQNMD